MLFQPGFSLKVTYKTLFLAYQMLHSATTTESLFNTRGGKLGAGYPIATTEACLYGPKT